MQSGLDEALLAGTRRNGGADASEDADRELEGHEVLRGRAERVTSFRTNLNSMHNDESKLQLFFHL